MRLPAKWTLRAACAFAALSNTALAKDILGTSGFSSCQNGTATIKVEKVNIEYNKDDKMVVFDVAGTSTREQNVTASLSVTAFGSDIFSNNFNPCDKDTFVEQLCPGKDPTPRPPGRCKSPPLTRN